MTVSLKSNSVKVYCQRHGEYMKYDRTKQRFCCSDSYCTEVVVIRK